MKKILFTLTLCVMTLAASAQVKSIDIKGDLKSDFGLGIGITSDLGKNIELAPSFNYYFTDGGTCGTIEADFHYDFAVANNWNVYPIAGVALHYFDPEVGDATTKFGVNLGVGTEYYVTGNVAAFCEAKYQWVDGYDDTYFSLGVKIGI